MTDTAPIDRANDVVSLDRQILRPALALLHARGGPPPSDPAARLLLAISGQEANWTHRVQRVKTAKGWRDGPARGLWQFERTGGVAGVLTHNASRVLARACCAECGVEPEPRSVHLALSEDDILACCFARLLLWTDPRPLPTGPAAGWNYYLANWRPGRPRKEHWARCWAAASATVRDRETNA
jgi:hypothetical protein